MKKKTIQFLFLAVCFVFAGQSGKAQAFNPNLAARLQTTLDSLVALLTNTKGTSASVYCPGQGIWTGASGLSYAGQPLTPSMQVGLASNSKLFTAVTMLKLAENNTLSLDDSLHEWIPNYANVNPNITIRQLLNHSSGVFDPFLGTPLIDSIEANPTHVYTVNEVLSYVGAPLFAPGAGSSYSNTNYILAGMVAESATGSHISQLIRNLILTPLNMDSTFYDIEEAIPGVIAHRWYNSVDWHDTSRVSLNTSGGPSGSMFSTPSEMAQWYNALMHGQFLSPTSFAEMTTFTAGNYGLGLLKSTYFGNTCWGHGGNTLGYRTRSIYDPCRKAYVCGLSNSSPSAVDGITALLYQEVVNRLPGCTGTLSGVADVCRGQNAVTFSVSPITNATSYVWTLPPGATGTSNTNTITVDFGMSAVSGEISVSGNNAYGVGAPASLTVNVAVVPTGVTLMGNTLSADSTADSYQWLDCDNGSQPVAGATGQSFTPTTGGNFAVVMTRGACSDTSACTLVTILAADQVTNLGIRIYPNPFSDQLTVVNPDQSQAIAFSLHNAMGQMVLKGVVEEKVTLSTSEYAPGIYFLRCGNGSALAVVKR
jgi:D-alanyl-D-alanine carboxypeptidase